MRVMMGHRYVRDNVLLQHGSIVVPLDEAGTTGSAAQLWLRPGHGRLRNQSSLCLWMWMVLWTQGSSSMITSAAATDVAAQHEPHAAIVAMH